MKYIQIYSVFSLIARQKHIRHLSWMKRFLERVQQISNAPARLAGAINALQAAVGGEDQAYLIITKSDLTAPIEEADKARDNTYSGISSMLDALSRLGTADQQQAASRVAERVAYHKVSINDRYEDESEKITQLVQDFKAGSLAADIATLGLTATVNQLEQQNQQVISLMKQRQTDRSAVESNAMGKARLVTDAAYEDVVLVLNAFAITEYNGQSSPYDETIRIINSDINYYSQYVFTNTAAGGGTNNGGGTTPTTPDTPGTDTPGTGDNSGDNTGGGTTEPNPSTGGGTTEPDTPGTGGDTGGDNGGGTDPDHDPWGGTNSDE